MLLLLYVLQSRGSQRLHRTNLHHSNSQRRLVRPQHPCLVAMLSKLVWTGPVITTVSLTGREILNSLGKFSTSRWKKCSDMPITGLAIVTSGPKSAKLCPSTPVRGGSGTVPAHRCEDPNTPSYSHYSLPFGSYLFEHPVDEIQPRLAASQ